VGYVGFWIFMSEREKGVTGEAGNNLLLPLPVVRLREIKDIWCRSKRHRFPFFYMNIE